MQNFGPRYCETGHTIGFLQEPVNAATSIIPLIAAAAILFYMYRHEVQTWYLHLLALFLALTGVGSFLWHGFREPWMLALDVLPGLFTLFIFAFAWAYLLKGRFLGYGAVFFLIAAQWLFSYLPLSFMLARFAAVIPVAAILISLTAYRSSRFALLAAGVLAIAILAAAFRTVDLSVCETVPFGTHFLWHTFLSLAVFAGAVFLIKLRTHPHNHQ